MGPTKRTTLMTLFCLVPFFASCDLFDVPEKTLEMADTTQRMSETTQDMSETTNGMSETTRRMQVNTDNMYHQIRTKEAQETRERTYQALNKAESFEEKLTMSVAYMMGFEYQLWTNGKTAIDTEEYRRDLQKTAVDEFFRKLSTFAGKSELDEISPASKNNNSRNLFAIAVTLHEIHDAQDQLVKQEGIEKISMLSMIEDALITNYRYENNEVSIDSFSEWMDGILLFENGDAGENRNLASGLLKLRLKMLTAMALSKVSNLNDKPDFNFLGIPGLWRMARHFFTSWDSKFLKLNHATQHEVNVWLEEAIKTRKFLSSIEMNSPLDSKVKKAFKKMNKISCDQCSKDQLDEVEKFEAQLSELLK